MISFDNPAAFFLILLIPLRYVLEHFGVFRKASLPLTMGDWQGKNFVFKGKIRSFLTVMTTFFMGLFYISAVIAFADPVVHHQEKLFTSKGTQVLIVLDTSPSMSSKDIAGMSRLEAARTGIHTFVEANQGATFGLVAMASEAAAVVPPTSDHELFLKRLDELNPGGLGSGSAIGIGLSTAVYHLAGSNAPKKCIILITDGENNAGSVHPSTAALLAQKNDISLYIFGIGTRGSVPMEYVDPDTGKVYSGYYESDFDSTSLEELAVTAGGKYYGIESTQTLLQDLNSISTKENVIQTFRMKSVDEHYYDRFLIFGLFMFAVGWSLKRVFLKEVL